MFSKRCEEDVRFRCSELATIGTIGDEIRRRIATESTIVASAVEWRSRANTGAGEHQKMGYVRRSEDCLGACQKEEFAQALSGITSGFSP